MDCLSIKKITRTVRKDFPELKYHLILVKMVRKQDFYMAVSGLWLFHRIEIDKAAAKAPKKAIKYLLAHELSHISLGVLSGEREADLLAIERGYLKGAIAFHEWHNKKYRKFKKKEGLTLKELKNII